MISCHALNDHECTNECTRPCVSVYLGIMPNHLKTPNNHLNNIMYYFRTFFKKKKKTVETEFYESVTYLPKYYIMVVSYYHHIILLRVTALSIANYPRTIHFDHVVCSKIRICIQVNITIILYAPEI